MDIYRITKSQYANDLSGYGSFLYGGRWNEKGHYALYASAHRSLAMLELIVHTPMNILKEAELVLSTISIPDSIPFYQFSDPYRDLLSSKKTGSAWLTSGQGLIVRVPSILMPEEYNFILNPSHGDYDKVKITNQRRLDLDARFSIQSLI